MFVKVSIAQVSSERRSGDELSLHLFHETSWACELGNGTVAKSDTRVSEPTSWSCQSAATDAFGKRSVRSFFGHPSLANSSYTAHVSYPVAPMGAEARVNLIKQPGVQPGCTSCWLTQHCTLQAGGGKEKKTDPPCVCSCTHALMWSLAASEPALKSTDSSSAL
ncbi:hypothetical protein EYF80_012034 [Liparis tanakae]|uniref:Uncharacterized protein n=1 Tax=Liparis tanakae TaxID=230148 RepID=A0A4Z2III2_9TELE|nr:hypothetical protein EYF80_012034 [Liparis tanakae]